MLGVPEGGGGAWAPALRVLTEFDLIFFYYYYACRKVPALYKGT